MNKTTINPIVSLRVEAATENCDALWVHPDIYSFFDLTPCEADDRPLKHLLTLTEDMGDSTITSTVGGLTTLTAYKPSIAQLVYELNLARSGGKGLFKKGKRHLFYLEGLDGKLVPVHTFYCTLYHQWALDCYRFGTINKWDAGIEVYGNIADH